MLCLYSHDFLSAPSATDPCKLQRLDGIYVLLAEDVPDNQFLLTTMLELAGAQVEVAINGQEAIDFAKRDIHDIILMDIQMPVVDGYEATNILRQQGHKKPIIALTSYAMKNERERCLALGFNDHLAKPISRKVLLAAIHFYVDIYKKGGLLAAGPYV